MPSTSPLRWPWLPIRGDREEAVFVSQACTSSPHSTPPPSLCAVILAPWCGRMFTTGWSEPRLLTPQHSPAALSVTRRRGRLRCLGFCLTCPPFPGPAAPTSLAGGPSWLTDSGSVIFFFLPAWAEPGWVRQGRTQAVVSLTIPGPLPTSWLLAQRPGRSAKPSHLRKPAVTSKLDKCNAGVTKRVNREPRCLLPPQLDLA